jgi:hypothetical protein
MARAWLPCIKASGETSRCRVDGRHDFERRERAFSAQLINGIEHKQLKRHLIGQLMCRDTPFDGGGNVGVHQREMEKLTDRFALVFEGWIEASQNLFERCHAQNPFSVEPVIEMFAGQSQRRVDSTGPRSM